MDSQAVTYCASGAITCLLRVCPLALHGRRRSLCNSLFPVPSPAAPVPTAAARCPRLLPPLLEATVESTLGRDGRTTSSGDRQTSCARHAVAPSKVCSTREAVTGCCHKTLVTALTLISGDQDSVLNANQCRRALCLPPPSLSPSSDQQPDPEAAFVSLSLTKVRVSPAPVFRFTVHDREREASHVVSGTRCMRPRHLVLSIRVMH